ncbi:MAG: hypothetical protein R6V35_03160 [Candidatus Nanohaloarchaea archaeon]
MRTIVAAMVTIVLVIFVIVGIYAATDVALNSAGAEFMSSSDFISGCLGGGEECNLFGGGN